MKSMILYYSKDGKTELVAKTLSKELETDIIKIHDLKDRTSIQSKITSYFDALRENKTEIKPKHVDLEDYNLLYIGTPVWSGKPTPAIITIIDKLHLRGIDVVLFSTSNSSKESASNKRMSEKVKVRGGRVVETFEINTKDKSSSEIVQDTNIIIQTLDLKLY